MKRFSDIYQIEMSCFIRAKSHLVPQANLVPKLGRGIARGSVCVCVGGGGGECIG